MRLPNRIVRFSQLRLCGGLGHYCCGATNINQYEVEKQRYFLTSLSSENSIFAGTGHREFALFICISISFVKPLMRLLFGIVAAATIPAWLGLQVSSAAAQTFNERWSIIPKAHTEPAPEAPEQTKQEPSDQRPTAEPTRGREARSDPRSSKRVFSGKASYYSYPAGKTASGSW